MVFWDAWKGFAFRGFPSPAHFRSIRLLFGGTTLGGLVWSFWPTRKQILTENSQHEVSSSSPSFHPPHRDKNSHSKKKDQKEQPSERVEMSGPFYSAAWDYNWDKRHPKTKEETPKATRHLILIRHGHYHQSETDPSFRGRLTKLGCEQAMATGYRLSSYPFRINKIVHSDMARAKETAEIIHKFIPQVPMSSCSLIAEGSPIPPIPGTSSQRNEEDYYRDGPRIEAAFRKYFHRADISQENDSYEVLVCHANVIRYFVCRALQVPSEAWLRMTISHCGITFIDIKPNGRVSLRGLGDTGHLEYGHITSSRTGSKSQSTL